MYFFGRVRDFFPPLPAYTSPGILLHARTCTQKKSGSPQRLPSCFCQSCLIAFLMHAYGFPLFDMSSTISRVLYLMTIFLDCMSPCSSSAFSRNATYRKARRAAVSPSLPQNRGMFWSCFEWGLHSLSCYQESGGLLHRHSTLTGGLPQKRPPPAVSFLLHWPWGHPHRTLSGTLPCEARTFLTEGGSPTTFRAVICAAHGCLFYHMQRVMSTLFCYHTLKQLPPTNSLKMELFGTPSLLTPRK